MVIGALLALFEAGLRHGSPSPRFLLSFYSLGAFAPTMPPHRSAATEKGHHLELTAAAGRNSRPFGRPAGTKPGIAALAGVQILPLDTHGRSLWERLGPA